MGFLFGKRSASVTPEVYTGIQVSTSLVGQPIPYVAGRTRIPYNLLWYGNFKSTPNNNSSGGSKGGGGSSGVSSYTYSTAFLAGLCMGPIKGVSQVWHDKSLVTLAYENLALALGISGPAPWSFLTTFTPPTIGFTGNIAGLVLNVYTITSGSTGGTTLLQPGQLITGPGVLPNTRVISFIGNAGTTAQYLVNIAQQVGQTKPIAMVASSGGAGSQALGYDHIAYVSTSAYTLGNSAAMPNLTFEVEGPVGGYNDSAGVIDADPSAVIIDYLTDPVRGAGFLGTIANIQGATNTYQSYCLALGLVVSPFENTQRGATDFIKELLSITNSEALLSVGTLKISPLGDQPVTGSTADGKIWTYSPNLTPIFIFGDADYNPKEGEPPVKLMRKPLRDTFNILNIEYLDRGDYYNIAAANVSDLNDIILNGKRLAPTISWHQITQPTVAKMAGQLYLQWQLYERNSYKFRVRADYALLEPLDYIALNDTILGLVNQVVRITEIEDTGDNYFTITALEMPGVVRSTPQYDWAYAQGYAANYLADPGSVLAPVIFQLPPIPASYTAGIALGIAVCGNSNSAFWGGCDVYCSVDGGNTYDLVGIVTSPARYGILNTAMTVGGADPDVTNTVSATLNNSNLQLGPVTHANADAYQTLCMVGLSNAAEVIAYGAETLVGPGVYNLTYLHRGAYGTPNQAHAAGQPFVRLDGNIFQIAFDPGMAGTQVLFKFPSFNQWGRAAQALSSVAAFAYTIPTGSVAGGLGAVLSLTVPPIPGAPTLNDAAISATGGRTTVYLPLSANINQQSASYASTPAPYPAMTISCRYTGTSAQLVFSTSNTRQFLDANGNPSLTYWMQIVPLFNSLNLSVTVNKPWLYNGSTPVAQGLYTIYQSYYVTGAPLPKVGDLLTVTYDGYAFRFFLNGTLVVPPFVAPGLNVYGIFQPLVPGGSLSDCVAQVGTAAGITEWTAIGVQPSTIQISKQTITRFGGNGLWNSGACTVTSFPTCHISAKANTTGANIAEMVGLASNPTNPFVGPQATVNSNYFCLDYAWYNNSGTWQIYEVGVLIGTFSSTASPNDVVSITWDGTTITYYLNGISQRTVVPGGNSVQFSGMVTILGNGQGFNSLDFGPTAVVGVADSGQLGPNAATAVVTQSSSNGTISGTLASPTTVATVSVPAYPVATTQVLTWAGNLSLTSSAANAGIWAYIASSVNGSYDNSNANASLFEPNTTNTSGAGVALEQTFSVAANTAVTYNVYAFKANTSAASWKSGVFKAEVIKR